MKTLNISISERDYKRYGLKKDTLSFSDILDLINKRQFKEHLEKSVELAEAYGLSAMTIDEISEEVNAARNAKNHH